MFENPLQIDADEPLTGGFYHYAPKQEKKKAVLGALDRMVQLKKADYENVQSSQVEPAEKPTTKDLNFEILRQKPKPKAQNAFDTAELELGIDPFTGQIIKHDDEEAALFQERGALEDKKGFKKKAQTSDHKLLRPQIVEGALAGIKFSKLGTLKSMTDDEYKQYIMAMGGKAMVSFSENARYVICGPNASEALIQKARKSLITVFQEDEFFTWVVQEQIRYFRKQLSERRQKEMDVLRGDEKIEKLVKDRPWVPWESCLLPCGLDDLARVAYLELNGVEPPQRVQKQKTATIDTFLKRQPASSPQQDEASNQNVALHKVSIPGLQEQPLQLSVEVEQDSQQPPEKPKQMVQPQKRQAEESFFTRASPQTIFELQGVDAPVKQLRQALKDNVPILFSGPVGSGKSTITRLLLKEEEFAVQAGGDPQMLQHLILAGMIGSQKTKCVIIEDVDALEPRVIQAVIKALKNRGSNRVVFTTSDSKSPKLKTLKNEVKQEAKLQGMSVSQCREMLLRAFRSEKAFSIHFRNAQAQFVDKQIAQISERCGSDIRQALLQLNFTVGSPIPAAGVMRNLNQFDFTEACFTGKADNAVEQYFGDPMMSHAFLVQNYLDRSSYSVRYASFVAELLSAADVIHSRMYQQGVWEAAKAAAIYETEQIGLVGKNMQFGEKRLQFPGQVLSIRQKDQGPIHFDESAFLSTFENRVSLELGVTIMDASFYLGVDTDEHGLAMNAGARIRDLLDEFELKYCKGSQKTKLIAWAGQEELEQLKGKK